MFGLTAPSFNVEYSDPNLNILWYSINGGFNQTFSTNETFRQDWWGSLSNGSCTITFYANDTVGNEASAAVIVWIDVIIPSITINSPIFSDVFNATAPNFNVSVQDVNLDDMWYSINGGANKTFFTNTSFDSIEWGNQPSGPVTIIFYANDSYGNFNSDQVIVTKDIDNPSIIINYL